jgi:hypothetical protein
MALPSSAAATIASDMAAKGGLGASGASDDEGPPSAPGSEDDDTSVLHDIAGDVVDAIQSGSKDEAAKFLIELVERCAGKMSPAAGGDTKDGGY